MQSHAEFKVSYDGPALRDHRMDVRDLAPALLSLANLFDEANRVLNGDRASIKLQVKATEEGSFVVALDVAQHWLPQIMDALSGEAVAAANNLWGLIGIGTGVGGGLLWLVRKLLGKQPDKLVDLKNGMVRVEFGGEVFEVPLQLLRLYQDLSVRVAVERALSPLERDGIDEISLIQGKEKVVTIRKMELPYYKAPVLEDQPIADFEKTAAYSIVSLAFKDDNKWRIHDGNNTISAVIEDADFLRRVNENQISFSKGDILFCRIRTKQWSTANGLKTEYEVLEVLDHKPPARQIPLNFE